MFLPLFPWRVFELIKILKELKNIKPLDEVKAISDINTDTTEGKLLIAALGQLSCQPKYSKLSPDEILRQLVEVAKNFS